MGPCSTLARMPASLQDLWPVPWKGLACPVISMASHRRSLCTVFNSQPTDHAAEVYWQLHVGVTVLLVYHGSLEDSFCVYVCVFCGVFNLV